MANWLHEVPEEVYGAATKSPFGVLTVVVIFGY